MKRKIAIIGSVGVPASYGGFETLVENIIGENCSSHIEYTVFCTGTHYHIKLKYYKGARLKYLPLRANGVLSVLYDGISLMQTLGGYDAVVALGVSGGIFFPLFKLLSPTKLIVNIDGLEWKRGKWGGFAKLFLRLSEELALRFSNVVIADNQAIVSYIKKRYAKKTVLIAYGGDHVVRDLSPTKVKNILSAYDLRAKAYAINICRIVPENNCRMILECFASRDDIIVMIGNFSSSKYGEELKAEYKSHKNIKLLDAIYDLDTLYALRSNSKYYVHGHSVGGSNPSLIEAMFCGCTILSYDVNYNRNTTGDQAAYFSCSDDLSKLMDCGVDNSSAMVQLANELYRWESIACKYEALY